MTPRVLTVITDSGVGGSEKVLLEILKRGDPAQFSPVAVVVLKEKREMAARWEKLGVPVIALGMGKIPTPFVFGKLRRLIRTYKPDVVHAFLYHSIQLSRLARAWGGNFKLVTSPRVNYRFAPNWAMWLDKKLRKNDDQVLCESTSSREYLINSLGYDRAKISVVLNGVDHAKYVFNPAAREQLRAEWGVEPGQLVIGAVGRLHHQKGFDVLLEAANMLKKGNASFKLVIVGQGPEKNNLSELAKNYSIDVLFTGNRSDLPQVYSAFDIFVQSSRYEGMSNALLEALSVGCATAATAVDGTLDVARDGENLVLVKPSDADSLALGLGHLMEWPDLRKKLSDKARESASHFTIEKTIRGFESVYQKVNH